MSDMWSYASTRDYMDHLTALFLASAPQLPTPPSPAPWRHQLHEDIDSGR